MHAAARPLMPGGRFTLRGKLGEGQYFSAYLAEDARAGGELVAVKVMRRAGRAGHSEHVAHVRSEERALRGMGPHRGVVELRDVLRDEPFEAEGRVTRTTAVVSSLCAHGELFGLVKACGATEERLARPLLRRVAEAVAHAHRAGYAHRDIKPEQVLLDAAMRPVLADWGFAVAGSRGGLRFDPVGTHSYMAPEVLSRDAYSRGYCPFAADAWSFGVLAYVVLCGFPPFGAAAATDAHYRRWKRGDPRFWKVAEGQGVTPSPAARAFLARLLAPEAAARATLDEALEDPWLACGDSAGDEECARDLRARHAAAVGLGLAEPAPVTEPAAQPRRPVPAPAASVLQPRRNTVAGPAATRPRAVRRPRAEGEENAAARPPRHRRSLSCGSGGKPAPAAAACGSPGAAPAAAPVVPRSTSVVVRARVADHA